MTAEARESLAKGQSPRSASHDGPLLVDAQQVQLPRGVRLPAQRLQRAAHPEEEAEGEGGDDGEAQSRRRLQSNIQEAVSIQAANIQSNI